LKGDYLNYEIVTKEDRGQKQILETKKNTADEIIFFYVF
jgi:hypothetical protein